MKQLLEHLRTFLIKLLAGDDMVIINADVRGCGLTGGRGIRTLVIASRFICATDQMTICPLSREDRKKIRQKFLEMNRKYRELQKRFPK